MECYWKYRRIPTPTSKECVHQEATWLSFRLGISIFYFYFYEYIFWTQMLLKLASNNISNVTLPHFWSKILLRYTILIWHNIIFHISQNLTVRGNSIWTRVGISYSIFLNSIGQHLLWTFVFFLCGDRLYLLSAFYYSHLILIVCSFSIDFAKVIYLLPNLLQTFLILLMLEGIFSTTYWLVKQPQQAPTIRYLLLCPSNIKNKWQNVTCSAEDNNGQRNVRISYWFSGFSGKVACW